MESLDMKIDIYTKPQCSWCDDTKNLLKKHEIDYTEHVIGFTVTRDEVLDKFPGATILPLVLVDDVWIGGRLEIAKILNERKNNV
jgi:glutaredoxin